MEQYGLSNSNIELACENVGTFLASARVDRREALRIKLMFEEVLLEYQEKFGEEAFFQVKCAKRLSSVKVEIVVKGDAYDPLDKTGEEDNVIRGLLSGIGLAPSYSYKNGRNYIVFIPQKKPLSGSVKMALAIVLAIIAGFVLTLLPDGIRLGVREYLLVPVSDAIMGLITAVSGPMIFLAVLDSICSMGNMETFGRIGRKTIKTVFLDLTVIGICMMAVASLFYRVEWIGGEVADFSDILDLIYDIVPSNLFEPFLTGNVLQLVFVATIVGLAVLVLSSRVSGVFKLIDQMSSVMKELMIGLSSMLPVLIFFLFTKMIAEGNLGTILNPLRMVGLFILLIVAYYVVNFMRIAIMKWVSPALLLRKIWPTLFIAITTASSAAAFSTNVHDTEHELGVDGRVAGFGTALGQVLFLPGVFALLTAVELTYAQQYGIHITPLFLVIAFITNLLLTLAVPPVPGGSVMCYSVAFAQLGIPLEALAIILTVDTIADFLATGCDVSSWQLMMIDVADSLGMLDLDTLRKKK